MNILLLSLLLVTVYCHHPELARPDVEDRRSPMKPVKYECPKGWEQFTTCGKSSCYKTLDWPKGLHGSQIIADNVCGSTLGGPDIQHASIHCEEENEFVTNKFGQVLLPLKYQGIVDGKPQFTWSDGSEVNYFSTVSFPLIGVKEDIFAGKLYTTGSSKEKHWKMYNDVELSSIKLLCKTEAKKKA